MNRKNHQGEPPASGGPELAPADHVEVLDQKWQVIARRKERD